MKYKVLLAVVGLITILLKNGAAYSQTGSVLTLKEAIDLSITNSKQLKSSQARIEEATATLKEAVERKLPDFAVSASHVRLNSPTINLKNKSSNANGGAPAEGGGSPNSATYGLVNASLPLYAGLRIRYGIESSRYLEQAAKLDAENDQEAVVLNTIDAYNNLFKSKAAVELVRESLEGARQRVKDFSNLEKNGLLPRNDLLKAQLQQSNTELSLLDAENNWKLANINMNLMLGLPDTTLLLVNQEELEGGNKQLKSVDEYLQLSFQNRKDIAALSFRQKAASTGVRSAKGGSLPSVALTGGYIAANVPNLLTVTNAINLGVGVQYSLSSLWKNGQLEQAKAREKQVEAGQELLYDNIKVQVHKAYQNYLLAQKKIEVYQNAIAQAEENYRIVKNKFQNQLANTTDLLDADVAQLQARLNGAFSKADASVTYYYLLQTTGLLVNQVNTK